MDCLAAYKINDFEHFTSKVTCFSKLGAIKVITDKLSKVQLEMFNTSCFGKLFHMNDLQFSGQLVHNLLLRQLECDDSDELWFGLPNGVALRFSMQEFAIITGLDCGPYPKDESPDECKARLTFSERMFHGSAKVSNNSLDTTFRGASSNNDEDIVKLALLYFLETVVLGKDPKNHIHREHIRLLDDLNAFNNYPWGRCCYEMTLSGMKKDFKKMAANVGRRNKVQKNKADAAFYSLSGFPYAFQIWACEAIPTIGKDVALKSGNLLPRILSWSTTAIPKSGHLVTLFHRSDLEAHCTLEPTPLEAKEGYCHYFVSNDENPAHVSFDSVASDNAANANNDDVVKATAVAFQKAQRSRRPLCHRGSKDRSNDHIDLLQAMQKQFVQFQQETTKILQETNKNLQDTNKKLQETNANLQETNKKVDMIIDFLITKNAVHTQHNPPPSKEKDKIDREGDGEIIGVEGSLPVAVDGSAEATREQVDRFGAKMTFNPIVPPKDIMGSLTIGSDASVNIIPETKCLKRKRRRGSQMTSSFEQFQVVAKKGTKFEAFPQLPDNELNAFKAWRDEYVPNELPTVRLPTGDCNRQWFRDLCKHNEWLNDSHIDAAFYFIRWKSMQSPTTKMESFTTTNILFQQHLLSKWDRYLKKKAIWEDDDRCIRYARGEESSHAWAGLTTLYMPLNYKGAHWVLLKVHFKDRTMTLFDSLGNYIRNYKQFLQPITTLLPLLLQKTDHYRKDAHMIADWYRKEGWTLSRSDETPQQEVGGGDCGIFVIKLAEHMANGQPVDSFDKSHITRFREQLALDLWKWPCQLWGGGKFLYGS